MQRHLKPLEQRLQMILRQSGLDRTVERQLTARIRIVALWQRSVPPQSFETVGLALNRRRQIKMQCRSRGTDEHSSRTVSPQRLVYYRSNWLLDAWRHMGDELRSFSIDSIKHPEIVDVSAVNMDEEELNLTLGAGYGIFSGKMLSGPRCGSLPNGRDGLLLSNGTPSKKATGMLKAIGFCRFPSAIPASL